MTVEVMAQISIAMLFVSLVLLTFVLSQVRALTKYVGKRAEAEEEETAQARRRQPVLNSLENQLRESQAQIAKSDNLVSEVLELLLEFRAERLAEARLRTRSAHGAQAPAPAPRSQAHDSASALPSPLGRPAEAQPARLADKPMAPEALPDALAGKPAAAAAAGDDKAGIAALEPLVEQYRELITQPRKSEINRWSDEVGGESLEVTDDGRLQMLSRDEGGLLVLLSSGDNGVVLPGGRLVVDFATSFANAMSMRRVTRDSFEFVEDGTGALRLVEPALARRVGDSWQINRPGTLAGLSSD